MSFVGRVGLGRFKLLFVRGIPKKDFQRTYTLEVFFGDTPLMSESLLSGFGVVVLLKAKKGGFFLSSR